MKDDSDTNMPALDDIVYNLCDAASLDAVWHKPRHNALMPSIDRLHEIVQRLQGAIFPGFFGTPTARTVRRESMHYHLAANLDSVYQLLAEQIRSGECFSCTREKIQCSVCRKTAKQTALHFLQSLPEIRRLLASDAQAAYEGDPAATSPGETIFCYPSLLTMTHHRIAHELYKLNVPVIPRIISEMAHSKTGIDIHPGAVIGEDFFIDHGTGVVIGETSVIGCGCRLYQGVTLGALSFPKESDGTLTKGIARHPILEDGVTVYAGATILGRITIGKNAVIGGNVWVTHTIEPGARILQEHSAAR